MGIHSPSWVASEPKPSRRLLVSSSRSTTPSLPSISTPTRGSLRRLPSFPPSLSIKLQEEERERRDNYVPDVSELEKDVIEVDAETKEMLKMMDFQSIPGLQMTTSSRPGYNRN